MFSSNDGYFRHLEFFVGAIRSVLCYREFPLIQKIHHRVHVVISVREMIRGVISE